MKQFSSRFIFTALAFVSVFACKPSNSDAKPSGAAKDPKAVVAKIGDTKITMKELEDYAKGRLASLEQEYEKQVYEEKKSALDRLIDDRLVEAKAKAANKSVEAYLESEIVSQVAEPTQDEIKAAYDQAKAAGQPLPELNDKMKADIAQFLKRQKNQIALNAFYDRLRAEASVEVDLPVYRLTVDATGPSKGPKDAKVTVVAFSDYQCPYCAKAESDIAEVLKAYPDTVRLVFKDFPLSSIHPFAQKAAEASHCADSQGKYWEMHDKIFQNYTALQVDKLKSFAKDLGLDQEKFDKCLDSGEKKKIVDESIKAAEALNVNSTPSFFVNGRPVVLARTPIAASLKEMIDEELKMKK